MRLSALTCEALSKGGDKGVALALEGALAALVGGDAHRRAELAFVGEEGGELCFEEGAHVLCMVRLVGFEEQERRRTVGGCPKLGEKERVARRDDRVGGKEASVAVVRVEAVALPGIVHEDDIGPETADRVYNLPSLANARFELAVRPAEEDDVARATKRARGSSLLSLAP
jgi:hypothetical protein